MSSVNVDVEYGVQPAGTLLDLTQTVGADADVYGNGDSQVNSVRFGTWAAAGTPAWDTGPLPSGGTQVGSADLPRVRATPVDGRLFCIAFIGALGPAPQTNGSLLFEFLDSPIPPQPCNLALKTGGSAVAPANWDVVVNATSMSITFQAGASSTEVLWIRGEVTAGTGIRFVRTTPTQVSGSCPAFQAYAFADEEPKNCFAAGTPITLSNGRSVDIQEMLGVTEVAAVAPNGTDTVVPVMPVRTRRSFGASEALDFGNGVRVSWSHVVSSNSHRLKPATLRRCANCEGGDCAACRPVAVVCPGFVTARACDFENVRKVPLFNSRWYHLVPVNDADFGAMAKLRHGLCAEFFRTPLHTVLSRNDDFEACTRPPAEGTVD